MTDLATLCFDWATMKTSVELVILALPRLNQESQSGYFTMPVKMFFRNMIQFLHFIRDINKLIFKDVYSSLM